MQVYVTSSILDVQVSDQVKSAMSSICEVSPIDDKKPTNLSISGLFNYNTIFCHTILAGDQANLFSFHASGFFDRGHSH